MNFTQAYAPQIITKFNVHQTGSGKPTLLFAHGFGCDQTIWHKVAPSFAENYHIVLFDYLGSGGSDTTQFDHQRYSTLDAYAEDLITICEALNLQNIYLIGHSVSGAIGMLASIQRPDLFTKLITIAPSPHYINEVDYFGGFDYQDVLGLLEMMHLNYFDWANYLAPIAVGNQNSPQFGEDLKITFLRNDPLISETFAKATFLCDLRDQLAQVKVPVCVLYCLEDIIVPVEVINYLQSHLEQCEICKIEATGHYPQITNPNSLVTAIQAHIQIQTIE
ncbi:sigma factor SigB regulation protein RsbQ [Thiosulfatimonas sediminis]|uniref:Sigma factor SigB regulation protein RsbQ n=1 Tax=Thiosulfatimonas sediminis TaxID=2675054 RepID=A0A6F8PUI5_9GAMM|nr:alpha/beta hydrolase [Thiosulfatimonas sediminis]BBP45785.1 sigma factor SigB regulation protein RsbQ [Thiosulfatimonas sediminis]